jgi:hypothetical protein
MTMDWAAIAREAGGGSAVLLWQVVRIVVPLMVLMALLEQGRVFERLSGRVGTGLRRLGLGEHAVLPLLVGALWGVTYGAGALLQVGREKRLAAAELGILGLFLGLSHALVEDTALFAIPGASLWWLLPGRLGLTVVFTALCWRWVTPGPRNGGAGANGRPADTVASTLGDLCNKAGGDAHPRCSNY